MTGTEALAAVAKLEELCGAQAAMNQLTAANQLTLLRMVLIPPFAILLLYGYRGWALVVFLAAGVTDMFDGLIARWTGQKTTLGRVARSDGRQAAAGHDVRDADAAWNGVGEPAAALVHDPGAEPRHCDRADGRGGESRGRTADVSSIDLRQDRDGDLHHDRA